MKYCVSKIISGGQTGADRGGLLAGRELGIQTGGTAPKGWRTEKGADHTLESFGLTQSTLADYSVRTRRNVENSDLTIIVSSDVKSPGTKVTIDACYKLNKPFVVIEPSLEINPEGNINGVEQIKNAILDAARNYPICINIAGNRESKSPGIEQITKELLIKSLS